MSFLGVSIREAVFFFEGGRITKEMPYPEFEAVLDHVVGVPDFAEQLCHAVFVRLDRFGRVIACVFFTVEFDADGYPDARWNIPLRQLAESGGPGPDLGAGPVRLSCRSQNSAPWFQQQLWDPEFASTTNSFSQIKAAVRSNTLGLFFDELDAVPERAAPAAGEGRAAGARPALADDRVHRARLAARLRQARLQLRLLRQRAGEEVADVRSHQVDALEQLQARADAAEAAAEELRARNLGLKERMLQQARDFEGVREQLTSMLAAQLRDAESSQLELLEQLQQRFARELGARVEAELAELAERLEMREVELFYRDEQLSGLRDEVALLRQEKQALLSESADQFLHRLQREGVTFVAFHRGVGHLNIPLADMGRYLDAPLAYAAEKGGVPRARYEAWLAHQDCPFCTAEVAGVVCGEPIPKVDSPRLFRVGESDRCAFHRPQQLAV